MSLIKSDSNIYAILGPTNTGKTYLAFERFITYNSGIFGFPLRLLARENYDKAIKLVGIDKVALVTGEEKIFPKEAKYFFCTIEAMPLNIDVECIVIDEIQLASDYERGHIFTDRILNCRGTSQTIFLGSLTIKSVLKKLLPNIEIETKNRLSKLLFHQKNKFSKLKPRSAIIAFNINKVYEIAESMRQQKGGAAVVLGSLSPRTRNAQVEVYESKKVNYLVATDAIGMGLNLNINHISFSSFQKFDGKYKRNLLPSEIGQIAGRAGRYKNDGTFGYTKDAGKIDPLIIEAVENHQFDEIEKIYWRNSNIDFSSINSVLSSLKEIPVYNFFIHKKNAEDEVNFKLLSSDKEVVKYLNNQTLIKLLWDVCRIPDFQKNLNDSYYDLIKNIFLNLINNDLKIPENWLHDKILRLDDYSGGIDELTYKIANIRTWTYISNQSLWLENNEYWKEKTITIENNLSDHLHESLVNRFVDFSASYFLDTRNKGQEPNIEIDSNKSISLNGQKYGNIDGFNLRLSINTNSNSLFSLNYVKKFIRLMIQEKINDFLGAPDDSINLGDISKIYLNEKVNIYWGEETIGFLKKGKNIFSPDVEVINTDFLEPDKKNQINDKLQKWIEKKIYLTLKPIKDELEDGISSEVRSVVYNLFNFLGTMPTEEYYNIIKNLDQKSKATISKLGIRIGTKFFFVPNFLKKSAIELNALLWRISNEQQIRNFFPIPKNGRVSFTPEINMPFSFWLAIGYTCIRGFAIRVDVFERIFFLARQKIKFGPFIESSDLMNPVGCNSEQLSNILSFCGFDNSSLGDGKKIFFLRPKIQKIQKIQKKQEKISKKTKNKKTTKVKNHFTKRKEIKKDPNSPFAVLQKLL